jgi:hypothetical protein
LSTLNKGAEKAGFIFSTACQDQLTKEEKRKNFFE